MYLISSSKLRKARQNYQNVLPYFYRRTRDDYSSRRPTHHDATVRRRTYDDRRPTTTYAYDVPTYVPYRRTVRTGTYDRRTTTTYRTTVTYDRRTDDDVPYGTVRTGTGPRTNVVPYGTVRTGT